MKQVTHIPKFRRFVIQNFPFIEEDFDALTDYGLICKIVEYLNAVIVSQNDLSDNFTELNNAFNELHDYVEHYFDNLDVQEEINNKLDVMAEDGRLTAIIKNYVDPIYQAYETEINQTLTENFESQNTRISQVEHEVTSAVTGTPLVASSTASMTDTNRIYVNTTDGHWYYYNGSTWVDGGVYQSAGVAENSVNGENLVENLQKSVNFEEPEVTINQGSFIGKTGGIGTLANGFISEGIKLRKGDTISFTAKGYLDNVALLSSYLRPDYYIPILVSQATQVYNVSYTVTYDGLYFLSSVGGDAAPSNIKIYRKNLIEPTDDTKLSYIKNLISDENTENVIDGYYIGYNSGSTGPHNNLKCTDFIEIKPFNKLELASKTNEIYQNTDSSGLAFYDENKQYISGVQYTSGKALYDLTPPTGAKYIRLTLSPLMYNVGYSLYYSDLNYTLDTILNEIDVESSQIDRTIGITSKAFFVGDSLTWGAYYTSNGNSYQNYYNYPYFLNKMMQFDSMTEIARGGATATSWWNSFGDLITQTDTVYFVWLGTNSTFTDTIDTDCVGDDYTQYANTETGNMGKILQKIKSLDNNRIVLLNCFTSGNHLAQTNEMLAKFATRFGVDVLIDFSGYDMRNTIYHTAYNGFVNSVHFNDKGNNYVANIVKNQLNAWLATHPFEMIKVHA